METSTDAASSSPPARTVASPNPGTNSETRERVRRRPSAGARSTTLWWRADSPAGRPATATAQAAAAPPKQTAANTGQAQRTGLFKIAAGSRSAAAAARFRAPARRRR